MPYLLHDCLIRFNILDSEQHLCPQVLKKPSKLNAEGMLYEEKHKKINKTKKHTENKTHQEELKKRKVSGKVKLFCTCLAILFFSLPTIRQQRLIFKIAQDNKKVKNT